MATVTISHPSWTLCILDYSVADDGFGNLIRMSPDMFWHNADAARIDRYSGGVH